MNEKNKNYTIKMSHDKFTENKITKRRHW